MAEDTSALWTSLTIVDDIGTEPWLSPARKIEESLRWLARAKKAPLSLSIQTINDANDRLIEEIIVPNLLRIKTLNLDLPLHFYRIVRGLPRGAGPILEGLRLSAIDSDGRRQVEILNLGNLFPRLIAALFSMKLASRGFIQGHIAYNMPWSQLRTLDIQEPEIGLIELQDGLARCTNLVSCNIRLDRASCRRSTRTRPLRATLRYLQHLSITFTHANKTYTNNDQSTAFFEPFTFPALKSLSIEGASEFNHPHNLPAMSLLDLVQRSSFPLEVLTLQNFDFVRHTDETIQFLKALTTLTSLNLRVKIPSREDAHLQLQFLLGSSYNQGVNDPDFLPELEHVSLNCVQQRKYPRPPMSLSNTRELGIDTIFDFLESRTLPPIGSLLKTADLKWSNVFEEWGGLSDPVIERAEELRRRGMNLNYGVQHY